MLRVTISGDKELQAKLAKIAGAKTATGRVWNDTSYGPFVQSYLDQAWMHRNRWHTDRSTVELNRRRYTKDLEKSVDHILEGRGATTGNPLRQWMARTTNHLFSAMEKYAPERPGQKYIRTFRLKNNWRKKVRG